MKKGATRKPSGEKSSKFRSLAPLSPGEFRRSIGERFSFAELPLARHDTPLGQLVPLQYNKISKGLANSFQWVRRAAGIFQSEDEKTRSKMAEWGTDGHNPASLENWNNNLFRKPIPAFPLNPASNPNATLFDSVPAEGGTGPCWDGCVCCEDGIDLSEEVGNSFHMKVFVPTKPLELLRTSEEWQRDLEQLDLQAPLLSGKTNWAAIREMHDMLKNILTILEARVNEISNKYELYRTSTNPNDDDDELYLEDSNDRHLYETLCKIFEVVSNVASERCFQALNLIANCIGESQDIANYASVYLLPTAMDLVEMYGRIRRVQEILVLSQVRTIDLTERDLEEEERAFNCACTLFEAISGYVISIQSHVLHSEYMQQDVAETPQEETSDLECLQQSWIWLNKLSKLVTVLCPKKKKELFVYLLETFIEATGEISQHQKLLHDLYDENWKDHTAAARSCQKILLHSLSQLLKNTEKAGLQFRKDGLIAALNFAKSADASRMFSITLTLLLSLVAEQGGTTISQSQRYSKTLQRYGTELMRFAKQCVEVIGDLARENAAKTDKVNERAAHVFEGQDNLDSELLESVELGAELESKDELPELAIDHNEEQPHKSLTSTNDEQSTQAAEASIRPAVRRPKTRSAFAIPSSHPPNESSNDALVPKANDASTSNRNGESQVVKALSDVADDSLDRRLPSFPSIGTFGIANINAMKELERLGNGSSGVVSLVLLDNSPVALKTSRCSNSNIAKERLERESKVHQRINSHPNIVRFLGRAVKTDEAGEDQIMGILTEWCESGNLSSAIKDAAEAQKLDLDGQDISSMSDCIGYQLYTNWIKRLEVVAGIAAGMAYMHGCHIVHRDLTSANVLIEIVSKSGRIGVRVCDFERAYFLKNDEPIQRTTAVSNSPPWMGVEVLNHEKYGLKADVHSIGTILWELMYLENPWTRLREKGFGADRPTSQHLLSLGITNLPISEDDAPDDVPEFSDMVRLVNRSWERDPNSRPTMSEFYQETMKICARLNVRLRIERNQS